MYNKECECDKAETELLVIFNEKFQLVEELGRECFIGDTNEMIETLENYFENVPIFISKEKETVESVETIEQDENLTMMKMVEYICPKCQYTANHKTNIRNHFKRVTPCAVNNINLTDILKNKILNGIKGHLCDQCDKNYASLQNLENHKKRIHEKKIEQKEEKIDEQIEKNENDFILNSYKDPEIPDDLDDFIRSFIDNITMKEILTSEDINECDLKIFDKIYFNKIYFNKDYPINHSIYYTNLSKRHVRVYDENKFMIKNIGDILIIVKAKIEEIRKNALRGMIIEIENKEQKLKYVIGLWKNHTYDNRKLIKDSKIGKFKF